MIRLTVTKAAVRRLVNAATGHVTQTTVILSDLGLLRNCLYYTVIVLGGHFIDFHSSAGTESEGFKFVGVIFELRQQPLAAARQVGVVHWPVVMTKELQLRNRARMYIKHKCGHRSHKVQNSESAGGIQEQVTQKIVQYSTVKPITQTK